MPRPPLADLCAIYSVALCAQCALNQRRGNAPLRAQCHSRCQSGPLAPDRTPNSENRRKSANFPFHQEWIRCAHLPLISWPDIPFVCDYGYWAWDFL